MLRILNDFEEWLNEGERERDGLMGVVEKAGPFLWSSTRSVSPVSSPLPCPILCLLLGKPSSCLVVMMEMTVVVVVRCFASDAVRDVAVTLKGQTIVDVCFDSEIESVGRRYINRKYCLRRCRDVE